MESKLGYALMTESNSITLRSYALGIHEYVAGTPAEVGDSFKRWIDKTLTHLSKEVRILEIGSGFGRDARYIESQGYSVERTDATEGFVHLLEQEGHSARLFNVLTQDFNVSYDHIFANAVFLHFTRLELEKVLEKIWMSLSRDGFLAFSVKKGDGEEWTSAKVGHPRYFCYWQKSNITLLLESKSFEIIDIFEDEKFLQIIAKKQMK